MEQAAVKLFMAAVLGVIALSALLWHRNIMKLTRGEPMLPREPYDPVPWDGRYVLLLTFALITAQLLVFVLLRELLDFPDNANAKELAPAQLSLLLLVGSTANLVVFYLAIWLLRSILQVRLPQLGLVAGRFSADLIIGVGAFVMLCVPVFLIQINLTYYWPSEHAVETLMKKDGVQASWWRSLAVVCFTALFVAPLVEEFVFRLVLQGWMQKRADSFIEGVTGQSRDDKALVEFEEVGPADNPSSWTEPQTAAVMPGQPQPKAWPQQDSADADWRLKVIRFLPIFISSAIFAGLHAGHGPDPIPLMLLAIGLGYLYQKTGRIVSCIVVHFLLNATSVVAMLVSSLAKQAGGELG